MSQQSLLRIAGPQHGYFTAKQAHQNGFAYQNHPYHVKVGNWLRVDRGIFRLPGYEDDSESAFVRWSLWATGRSLQRQVVVSHESALAHYRLSGISSHAVHLTVYPSHVSRAHPAECVMHCQPLAESEVLQRNGYRITTPLRTLLDMRSELVLQKKWGQVVGSALQMQLIDEVTAKDLAGEEVMMFGKATWSPWSVPTAGVPAWDTSLAVESVQRREHGTATSRRATVANRSFTLVEMLVVVAIISILACLLMPALHNALASARTLVCSSNLQQLHVGNRMYAESYIWMVPAIQANTEVYAQEWWSHKIRPFLGDNRIPASWDDSHALRKGGVMGCPETEPAGSGRATYSYAMNSFGYPVTYAAVALKPALLIYGTGTAGNSVYAIKPESISRQIAASRLLVLSELGADVSSATGDVNYSIRNGDFFNGTAVSNVYPVFRHIGKKNVLFLDGHVAPVLPGFINYNLYSD